MRILLHLLLLTYLPFCATAQKYLALQYGQGEGLPSEQVRDRITGEYGFLWVAADGGLVRFDGERFTPYNGALDSYCIKALAKDTAGRVVFINDSGFYRLIHRGPDTAFIELLMPAPAQFQPIRPCTTPTDYLQTGLATRHGQVN